MKKLLLKTWLLLACLLLGVGSAWAEEITWTAADAGYANQDEVSSVTVNTNISFTFDKGTGSNAPKYYTTGSAVRVYGGNTITVNASNATISGITFSFSSGEGTNEITADKGTFESPNWSGSSNAVTFTIGGTTGHRRISKITVTYTTDGGGSTPTTYTVTVANNISNGTVTANPTSAAEGATITLTATPATGYKFDSWNVTNASTSAAITVTNNKFTMPAANVNVSASFTAIPEKTIAEFIASEGGKCYLTGIVSNITNTTYGNFDLTDESGTIFVYGCLTSEGVAKQFSTLDVVAGDKIKVLAEEYELYNETKEAKNVIFVEEIAIPKAQYTVTIETPENGTLVVKDGDNVLASGDKVEEGNTLTIVCTPTDAETYRYKNWQYKEDGNWVTMTSTMTRVVTQDISIRANFELIPVYTIAWSVNGEIVKSEELKEGAAVSAPTVEDINDKVFTGWVTTSTVAADATPGYVTPSATATETITYYAVFATSDGSNEATLTKLNGGSTLSEGDDIVVVAQSGDNYYVMYQETVSTSYVNYKALDHAPVLSNIQNDAKMSWTLTASENNTWILGDATNGYLQNATNNLYANTEASTPVTIAWNNEESKFTIKNGERWIACRADLTGANQYKYRGAGTQATPTSGSIAYFDIYCYASSSVTYSDFTTTVAAPLPSYGTLTFVAEDADGYWATFSSTEDVIFDANDVVVYTVAVDDNSIVMIDACDNSLACVTDKTQNSGWVAGYYVQAGAGVLINATDNSVNYYYIDTDPYTPNQVTDIETDPEYNMLRPASASMETSGYSFYKLAYGDWDAKTGLGFYYGAADGGAFTAKAGGAYLAVPASAGARAGYAFNGDEADGLEAIELNAATTIYTLDGTQINELRKGLNIVNGKKVMVK